ncbi:DNA methyltransferase Dim-2, partial [Ascosphaera atra]
PPISERQFLKHVEEVYGPDATSGGSNAELDLTSFTIYAESDLRDGMLTLDQIATRQGRAVFLFDGFLDLAGTKHYLSHVPFSFVSIGGYEDLDTHAVDDALWIQSVACERGDSSGLWYRLDKPSKAYQEHHRLFTWVAGLAKHFLDYLAHHTNVALDAFRADFARWIDSVHGPHPEYQAWRSKHPAHDFRHAVVAHADFLQKQALDMDAQADDVLMTSVAGLGGYQDHLLWHQIVPSQTPNLVMPEQPQRARGTVVTPYVRECFKEMEWGSFLHAREPREEIAEAQRRRIQAMGFNMRDPAGGLYRPYADVEHKCGEYNGIRVGDVVAVPRDVETKWKGNEDDLWFALVTEIRPLKYTARLFVLWLYKPSDTLCAHLTYLPKRELFLSNHCNCDSGSLYASEVVRKVDVAFYSVQPPKGKEDEGYFVRQTYFSDDGSFATLEEPDFICPCKKEKSPAQEEADEIAQYAVGDTVLVERITDASDLVLEPAEILTIDGASFTLRPLRRRSLYDGTARPNELLYTYDPLDVQEVNVEQVDRKCHVRAFTPTQPIPAPYDRDGTGDFFYVRAALRDGGIVPLDPGHHVTFKQGYMLEQTPADKKLRALNIFCGGGTFDRGLEEGGAVQSEWAVEWDVPAMLTYLANHNSKDERHPVKCFCGSVDDYLHQAQDGASSTRDLVARCGEVDFISAGSPCQGYSTANQHKKNERSLRNSSMIASVASYVDFYRPKYAILENVVSMSNSSHERNPLAQLVCAFVGMGYQLRILNLGLNLLVTSCHKSLSSYLMRE